MCESDPNSSDLDLIVLDKVTRRTLAIQVKSAIASPSRGTVQFDVRKVTHSGTDREYLVMVVFDPARIALTASWLIPMAVVPDVATTQAEKFALVPSLNAGSGGRYRPYRCNDVRALTAAVQRALDGSDR